MMEIPGEQVIIGIFALLGATITGAFSIYKTKLEKKVSKVEEKVDKNKELVVGNEILEQIVPALERKDEALDKIAEILDNILRTQALTSQQLRSIQLILENRCQAVEVVKALKSLIDNRQVQHRLDSIENLPDDTGEILSEIITSLEEEKK
jgi:uncharacterized protein YcbK (DUF882 family)